MRVLYSIIVLFNLVSCQPIKPTKEVESKVISLLNTKGYSDIAIENTCIYSNDKIYSETIKINYTSNNKRYRSIFTCKRDFSACINDYDKMVIQQGEVNYENGL